MKTIEEINQHNVKKILSEKKIPDFFPGDVVKVGVRITEGKKERIQYFLFNSFYIFATSLVFGGVL